ncbi:hypothetical protein CFN78_01155 [Amycolatopsis antarctica]|uniref:Mce-associated membrane protein n=1 Tax=Amycolatopsis antarctica TaxID=1854586 RepID=A0A263DBA8_9PSEU|nr:hypothetical protein CFN78_01155 [Amycolatopsis antarctica]
MPADVPVDETETLPGKETTPSEKDTKDTEGAGGAAVVTPRPSPRRKTRDHGAPRPESQEDTVSSAPEPGPGARASSRAAAPRRSRTTLAAVLVVVALLFAGLAVFFKIMGDDEAAASNNTALIDVSRTSQVKGEVTAGVEALFSYDFNDIAKTEQASGDLLVNDEARNQYNSLFAEVKRLAPEQKMVVTFKVTRTAVVLLDDDRAKVLVFGDQTATRTDQNQTSAGGSQFSVDTELRDGKWKIAGLDFYSDGQQPEGQPPAPLPGTPPEGGAPAPVPPG